MDNDTFTSDMLNQLTQQLNQQNTASANQMRKQVLNQIAAAAVQANTISSQIGGGYSQGSYGLAAAQTPYQLSEEDVWKRTHNAKTDHMVLRAYLMKNGVPFNAAISAPESVLMAVAKGFGKLEQDQKTLTEVTYNLMDGGEE